MNTTVFAKVTETLPQAFAESVRRIRTGSRQSLSAVIAVYPDGVCAYASRHELDGASPFVNISDLLDDLRDIAGLPEAETEAALREWVSSLELGEQAVEAALDAGAGIFEE